MAISSSQLLPGQLVTYTINTSDTQFFGNKKLASKNWQENFIHKITV